jgi:hypothetical protein
MSTKYNLNVVTDGLVLCLDAANKKSYSGSGTALNDRSVSNYDATLTNGASFDATDQSISLDGTDDYIDLGADKVIKTSGGWTVESWIKFDTIPGSWNNVTSPGNFIGSDSISYNSWYWSVLSGKLALWNLSPGFWKYGSTTLQANTWYNAALVSYNDGVTYQMYLNGVAEGGDHTSASWVSTYSGLRIRYMGRGNSGNVRQVDGKIPSTRVYDRVLTAAEVLQNFNATKSRFSL